MSSNLSTRLILALWIVLSSAPARAQGENVLSAQQNAKLEEFITIAKIATSDGRYEEAIENFHNAYNVSPQSIIIYNLAQVHKKFSMIMNEINAKSRQLQLAVDHYDAFIQATEPSTPDVPSTLKEKLAATRRMALIYREECRRALAQLTPPTPIEDKEKPAYKKWWFWTALIGSTAIALGVGLGLGLRSHATQIPEGVTVFEINF